MSVMFSHLLQDLEHRSQTGDNLTSVALTFIIIKTRIMIDFQSTTFRVIQTQESSQWPQQKTKSEWKCKSDTKKVWDCGPTLLIELRDNQPKRNP